jgi:hypothetical protein
VARDAAKCARLAMPAKAVSGLGAYQAPSSLRPDRACVTCVRWDFRAAAARMRPCVRQGSSQTLRGRQHAASVQPARSVRAASGVCALMAGMRIALERACASSVLRAISV